MSENYKVLARRYRPQKFSEVVEQTHAIQAIENAIKEDRLGSAYLFYGPRGVGKTTIARILAKRVNCLNPHGVEPCNECESCKEILSGTSLDVIEIDAATNRRIIDIRDLRENVKFRPILGQKKVYIIDEVHMLTKESFNALLKTLEEPPPHILFILATTEINKIPETILSRCQIFTFRKVPIARLQKYLEMIAKQEKILIDEDSLFLIAKKGDGSVRDSLSFFEQVISYCGGKITYQKVRELMGSFPFEIFYNLTKGIFEESTPEKFLKPIMEIFDQGGDIERFIWEYLEFLRVCVLIKKGITDKEILGILSEDIQKLQEFLEDIYLEKIFTLFEEVYQLKSKAYLLKIQNSFEAKILIEVMLLKVHDKIHKPSLDKIIHDLNTLTKILEGKDVSEEYIFGEKNENSKRESGIQLDPFLKEDLENKKEIKSQRKENLNQKEKTIQVEQEIQNQFLGTYVDEENIPKI